MKSNSLDLRNKQSSLHYQNNYWAYDNTLSSRILCISMIGLQSRELIAPYRSRIRWIFSYYLFTYLEKSILKVYEFRGFNDSDYVSKSHTRLLSSFLAINAFFWFVDPSQGLIGVHGGQLIRSIVLVVSSIVLFRSWKRDPATYRRESTSDSLRRQLQSLPDIEKYLEGRRIDELSSESIYTLAKALPNAIKSKTNEIYKGVVTDLFKSGSLNRAAAL